MRGGTDVLFIELKRPGETAGLAELDQIRNYVFYLREWLDTTNTEGLIGRNITGENVKGYLLCYDIGSDSLVRRQQDALKRDGINVCKWYNILIWTQDEHREFLDIVKSRAPEDDPRIKELEEKGIT